MTFPVRIRAVAEIHDGPPWSWAARERLLRYVGELNFTHYLYAPGGDPLVRERWREPYLPDEVDLLQDMAQIGARRGVAFCCGLSVPEPDAEAVLSKLWPLYDAGIRGFVLLDLRADGAEALCRVLLERLPGAALWAETGPEADLPPQVERLAGALTPGRRPPLLWAGRPGQAGSGWLPLRPAHGLDPAVAGAAAGLLVPCPALPEVGRVMLHTWAAYLRNPDRYDPERAWVQALAHVAPSCAPSLRLLGDLTRGGAWEPPIALPELADVWTRPDRAAALAEVAARFEAWSRAAEALKDLPDKPLRDDLRPWVAKLAASADAGLKAIRLLSLTGTAAERFRGQVLAALWRLRENPAVLAGDQVERFVRECIRRA